MTRIHQGTVWSAAARNMKEAIDSLCEAAGLAESAAGYRRVVVKPNLVEALDPPITTPVEIVAAILDFLLERTAVSEICIGEGTGSLHYDTFHCFDKLGYLPLADRDRVELLDLNTLKCRHLRNESCRRWPDMYLPEVLFDSFLISVPVLKAHSLSRVTLTMKNMMGCAPPAHYRQGGGWGKASFHRNIHEAIFDLNRYRTPDFTVLDASVGMAKAHLWGPTCRPPVGIIAAGYDPVAIDAYGCSLLKRRWRDVGHISMANGRLGCAEPVEVREPETVRGE